MKKFGIFALALFISCGLTTSNAYAKKTYKTLIQIVVDDTGVLQDGTNQYRQKLLEYIRSVAKESSKKDQVVVISQWGSQNMWSGQPRMMLNSSRNAGLQSFLQSENRGCSDLERLFELFSNNIYLYPAKNHKIVFFSSLIHTGSPCSKATKPNVGLTEKFIEDLDTFHKTQNAAFEFYWVYDDGPAKIFEDLIEFFKKKGIDQILRTEAETRSDKF